MAAALSSSVAVDVVALYQRNEFLADGCCEQELAPGQRLVRCWRIAAQRLRSMAGTEVG